MQTRILILLFEFMQVLDIKMKHSTKNEHFTKHTLFSIIYLLQKQKLNPNKYSKQEINMGNFVQANGYEMNMNAQF
jgi:hypothetical protein